MIPARGGSKRIPKKNIRNFVGKPLIAWSIECAINSGLFSDVFVSTDDLEIKKISEFYNAKVPYLRPKEISDDYSNDSDVRNHFLNWLRNNKIEADILCYLYPTAPFINKKTLNGCKNLLLKLNCSCVYTITDYPFSPTRALYENKDGKLEYMWCEYKNKRSQDLPTLFHDAGQCYFFNLHKKNHDSDRYGYKIPRIITQDIDTEEDFINAEILFKLLNIKNDKKSQLL